MSDKQWNPPKSLASTLLRGNNGHAGLRLPITWSQDENGVYTQDKDDLEAHDCIYFVQDKLLHTLDTLYQHGLIEFYKICWDWRRSFQEAVDYVEATIKSICKDGQKAIVVSHSTGALVTWPTIDRHPEYFVGWINVAGCLLNGTNTFLKDFRYGYSLYGGVLRMVAKETFFTFAGLYSYFPTEGEEFGGVGESDYVDANGKYYKHKDIDIYKVETWEQFKLGIYGWKKGAVTLQEREHIQHSLDAAKRLRETILVKGGKNPHDPSFLEKDISEYSHLKIVCYGADKLQAHSAYQVDIDNNTMDVSASKLTAPGDGTLFNTNWQTVPGGLKRDVVLAEDGSDHVSLVNDAKLQALLVDNFFADDQAKKASARALLKLK